MRRRRGALGGAQFCRTRARIGGYLRFVRGNGTLGQDLKTRRGLRQFGQMPRTSAGFAARVEEILDDAVFQRMKRHNDQPAAGLQHALGRRKRQMQLVEFRVDEDPKALERPRRRVNFVRFGANHLAYDIGQLLRRRDRRLLARRHDGARDGARVTLLAENIDDVGKIGLGCPCNDIRSGRAVMAHPHVERTAEPEREAALGLIELHRGNADIHHDAIDGGCAFRGADLGEVGEAVLDQGQPAVRPVDQIEPASNRRPVAVDADDAGSPDIEDRAAVAAGAEGCVDIDAAVTGSEHLDGLAAENGDMTWRSRVHAPAPSVLRSMVRKLDANRPIAPQISALCRTFPAKKPLHGRDRHFSPD